MSAEPGAEPGEIAEELNALLRNAGQMELAAQTAARFQSYCSLLLRWNTRINLTAIRDREGILRRHFLESIVCARAIPEAVRTLLDLGSGAGFPGIPIALCRPEIAVTLAESQGKKSAFLREAARETGLSFQVHDGRAETLDRRFDCVTLRAVDRMSGAMRVAAALVGAGGWLALLTTGAEAENLRQVAGAGFAWSPPMPLPGATDRILLLGQRDS
ncbi:MAG TPA: 16S rRNA (guanine(527)-N(7))-methyltransferase RsmG [Terracidiphilus sp.]|jgi:16S rRNA (guanine527-N7)-methyltransferase|nr:16S rRNA (guanine(527)-N(7))-methyltransferase RsmG [Terracidiphilus sp.]